MNAIVLHGIDKLQLDKVSVPGLRPGTVRLRVAFCGVCGSDIPRCFSKGTYSFPTICGHEFAGTIEALGEGVTDWKVGDRVAVFPLLWKDDHPACETGHYARSDGYDYLGSRSNGGFAEYVVAPVRNLIRVPDAVSFEEAAMTEPAAVALHAARRAGLAIGETAAIFGLGPIGLMLAQWLRTMGAQRIFLFDLIPQKLDLARQLGFTDVYNSRETNYAPIIAGGTGGRGVHVAFEAAGVPPTASAAIESVRSAGRIVFLGNPSSALNLQPDLVSRFMRREASILGTWNSGYSVYGDDDDWRTTLAAMQNKQLNLLPLITHRVPLTEGIEALQMMRRNTAFFCKVMIHP